MVNSLWKTHASTTVLLLAALAVTTIGSQGARADDKLAVAKVNGMPIYRSDLDCALEAALINPRPPAGRISDPSEMALHRLIDIELLYQEGLKLRLPGIEEEVERRYAAELERLGGSEGMAAALACVEMTPEDLKRKIFRNLTIKGYLDREVYRKIVITDVEIQAYYRANPHRFSRPEAARIKQILIRVKTWGDPSAIEEAHHKAQTVYGAAVKGTDFMLLARRYSEDPSGASASGDMGVITRGNLQTHIDSVIFSLPPGGISQPVKSRRGYHIFKVVSVDPSAIRPLEEVTGQIIARLRHMKSKSMINELLDGLRSRAKIEILVQPKDAEDRIPYSQ
ncbi:MAG: peptidylprolyl isomerase [bacterium]|nr:MAG: peptidylprolyl isomerase [bacterium]